MMDPEIKARWTAALRSGEYRQGPDYLKYSDFHGEVRHCCLGVLCEIEGISSKPGISPGASWSFMLPFEAFGEISERDEETSLPDYYADQLGLKRDQPILMEMNDGAPATRQHSFTEIADWIDENL